MVLFLSHLRLSLKQVSLDYLCVYPSVQSSIHLSRIQVICQFTNTHQHGSFIHEPFSVQNLILNMIRAKGNNHAMLHNSRRQDSKWPLQKNPPIEYTHHLVTSRIFARLEIYRKKWRPFWKNVLFRLSQPLNGFVWKLKIWVSWYAWSMGLNLWSNWIIWDKMNWPGKLDNVAHARLP